MPAKRNNIKGAFDPNKSDSDDENYEVETKNRSRKSSKRSRPQNRKPSQKKRRKRNEDSDITQDSDGSEEEDDSFSEHASPSEAELDEVTGRPKRKAKAVRKNYAESEDEEKDLGSEIEEPTTKKRRHVVKLKLKLGEPPAGQRIRRAGSAARGQGISLPLTTRRNTRATTVEEEDLVQLSTSGRHEVAIRASHTPDPQPLISRSVRGSKSVKQPPAIKEAAHESSSYEHADEDVPMIQTDIPESDPNMAPARSISDSHDEREDAGDDDNDNAESYAGAEADGDMGDKEPDVQPEVDEEVDDEDDEPVISKARSRGKLAEPINDLVDSEEPTTEIGRARGRLTRKSGMAKNEQEQGSDFEPDHDTADDEISGSEVSPRKNKGDDDDDDDESPVGRGRSARLGKSKGNPSSRRRPVQDDSDFEDEQSPEKEAAEELQELGRRKRPREIEYEQPKGSRRARKQVDYSIKPLDDFHIADEEIEDAATPSRKARGRDGKAWDRSWANTYGPFGGGGGPPPIVSGPWAALAGADSDSSDDEGLQRPPGAIGMTPTSAMPPPGLLPGLGQHNAEMTSGPANVGRVKSGKALADADPLGVDMNVDFSKIGGLDSHIDQLKEMVQMPLLYPEIFMKLHVTPPRGVLFHGPPGTGKTLVARALAASVGTGGKKVTFYMRKGADALSKWVGEAERQLRLLFEEARKTQPSIIFFDEIDGLAPVRSSKQEQIHASIVSTLLALMDGMDGRGQVIVIGATNRPDNIDPALRRPGRFDREFYFALPDTDARRSIINIHTNDWGLDDTFKDELAKQTKGYGGADLRALCTEAALNAVQRTFPQIYLQNEKLLIDESKIKITAKDFMISIKKVVPSSQRSTSSGAAPLPKTVEPLLREQLIALKQVVDSLIPVEKKPTALQEAMFEQYDDQDRGFSREILQQEFEKARVFRPRLLVKGSEGMGQGHLGAALLDHFEGLHVQSFDLATLFDSDKSPEAAIIQLFAEVKRHKPSVIYLPDVSNWCRTVQGHVLDTFLGMLKSIPSTDPVLVFGITDEEDDDENLDKIFKISKRNVFVIERPSMTARNEFFKKIVEYASLQPKDFPNPLNRKKRTLEELPKAPTPPPHVPTAAELKAQQRKDNQTLNQVKIRLQPVMDEIKKKYKIFHAPVIARSTHDYLFQEQDPNFVRPDVSQPERPYELDKDSNGVIGLRETATGKFFYNMETATIEERLANGFYCRPSDFLTDIRHLCKDNKQSLHQDRRYKAGMLLSNVEIDVDVIENQLNMVECENVYQRQLQRTKDAEEKRKKKAADKAALASPARSNGLGGVHASGMQASSGGSNLEGTAAVRGQVQGLTPLNTSGAFSSGHGSGGYSAGAQILQSSHRYSAPPGNTGLDVEMSGTESYGHHSEQHHNSHGTQPLQEQWPYMPPNQSSVSAHATGVITQHSMQSSFQRLPTGVSPSRVHNSASSTASEKRTSVNQTPRSSDAWSTDAPTNGFRSSDAWSTNVHDGRQDSSQIYISDSQLPDTQSQHEPSTQVSSGDDSYHHYQAHGMLRGTPSQNGLPNSTAIDSQNRSAPPIPPFPQRFPYPPPAGTVAHILNSPTSTDSQARFSQSMTSLSSTPSSQKPVFMDKEKEKELLNIFVQGTKQCTVEMLEQVYRELMVTLWNLRGEFNRTAVANALADCFKAVISDIEEMRDLDKGALGRNPTDGL